MVWYGMVWYGAMWCGMVWCDVVWCGVMWCGVMWCCVVWYGSVLFDVVWGVWYMCVYVCVCDVVWCYVTWWGVVFCVLLRCCIRACVYVDVHVDVCNATEITVQHASDLVVGRHSIEVTRVAVLCQFEEKWLLHLCPREMQVPPMLSTLNVNEVEANHAIFLRRHSKARKITHDKIHWSLTNMRRMPSKI